MDKSNEQIQEVLNYDLNLTDIQIGWIAGLLEGEGSFGIDKRSKSKYKNSSAPPTVYISISMTDADVIDKFGKLVKKEPFYPKKKTKGGKTENRIYIGDKKTCFYLLNKIIPELGTRKKETANQQLIYIHQWIKWVEGGGKSKAASYGGKS